MRLRWFKFWRRGQSGFTLVELMVAVAITGIISLGAAVSSAQVINQTSRDRDYTLASRQATNAIFWISHDALMAQNITGYEGFPADESLSLSWVQWDNTSCTVTYTVENGTLTRTWTDGAVTNSTFIAGGILTGAGKTFCSLVNNTLNVTITGSAGSGSRVIEVTKTKQIASRPKL